MSQGALRHDPRFEVGSPPAQLFAAFGGALAWVIHFMGSYAFITIACASRWLGVGPIVGVGTLVMSGVAAGSALLAWRNWKRVSAGQRWTEALSEPHGWFAWLMLLGVLVGGYAAFVILLQGMGAAILPVCEAHAH